VWERKRERERVCVFGCVCVWVCLCVHVWGRQNETFPMNFRACVCVCVWERECVCVFECVYVCMCGVNEMRRSPGIFWFECVCERERVCVCLWVCVCVHVLGRQNETFPMNFWCVYVRERECVRMFMSECVCTCGVDEIKCSPYFFWQLSVCHVCVFLCLCGCVVCAGWVDESFPKRGEYIEERPMRRKETYT